MTLSASGIILVGKGGDKRKKQKAKKVLVDTKLKEKGDKKMATKKTENSLEKVQNGSKETALAKPAAFTITADDVKRYFDKENRCTPNEVALFLRIAREMNLNPFKRELHLVKYGTQPASIVTGYEVYIQRAEASKNWGGFKVWTTGEAKNDNLVAHIEVYRKDWEKPLSHEVEYSEYVGRTKDGNITRFWREKPKTMLKKVAISQAFRFAFPDILGGLPYTADEISDIGSVEVSAEIVEEGKAGDLPSSPEAPRAKETPENGNGKPRPKDPTAPASEKQIKFLHFLLDKKGVSQEQVKARSVVMFNKTSSKELNMGEMSEIIDYYSKFPDKPKAAPQAPVAKEAAAAEEDDLNMGSDDFDFGNDQ